MSLPKDIHAEGVAIKQLNNGELRVVAKPYYTAVSFGQVPNHEGRRVLGHAAVNAVADEYDVSSAPVNNPTPLPSALQSMELISSSLNDAAAGTGATSVLIRGLTTADAEVTETVTPTGTTGVTLANQYRRINDMIVVGYGSNGGAVGDIDIQDVGGGSVYARVEADHRRARLGAFTVPAGKKAVITSWKAGSILKELEFLLLATAFNGTRYADTFIEQDMILLKDNTFDEVSELPQVFPALTDIKVTFDNTSDPKTGTAFTTFEVMIEDA